MRLKITLQGADRKPLNDSTRVLVYREKDRKQVADVTVKFPHYVATIDDLEPDVYVVRAFPEKHRASAKFARPNQSVTLHCPIDPSKVRSIDIFDPSRLNGGIVGSNWFDDLSIDSIAGLMNIWSKLQTTCLDGVRGKPLSSLVKRINRVNPDRIWFEPHPLMLELARQAVEVEEVVETSGSLHSLAGYVVLQSFKTLERYGNLQLTFLESRANGDLLVDADIDEASGIGHLFQVLRNALPGRTTDPYDIHEILTFHQELDVGYDLVV